MRKDSAVGAPPSREAVGADPRSLGGGGLRAGALAEAGRLGLTLTADSWKLD